MAQDLPRAEGEPCPLRQISTLPAWRALRCSGGVFKAHPVVYQRGEVGFDDEHDVLVIQDILPWEVAAVCDVTDHQSGRLRC